MTCVWLHAAQDPEILLNFHSTMAKKRPSRGRQVAPNDPPTCNCALLCDDVIESRGRGKHTLVGIIGVIHVRQLPARLGGYVAYVRLSNIIGSPKVRIGLDEAATNEEIFGGNVPLPSRNDPLGVYTLIIPVPAFQIERPGRYMFSVKSDGVPLAESPIMIQAVTTEKEEEQ